MKATPSAQDVQLATQLEVFSKIASEKGVDLNKLTDAQVYQLFNDTFKLAEAPPFPPAAAAPAAGAPPFPPKKDGEDKKEDKKDGEDKEKKDEDKEKKEAAALLKAATAEFDIVRAKHAQIAEAEEMGRHMARTFVEERTRLEKEAAAGQAPTSGAKTASATVAEGLSAVDRAALGCAVKMASDAGFDVAQAQERVRAVATLGLGMDGSKCAAATSPQQMIETRALEYLEAAGYPVTWETK